jgi:hypothetical protein
LLGESRFTQVGEIKPMGFGVVGPRNAGKRLWIDTLC